MSFCIHCHKGHRPPNTTLSAREAEVIRAVVAGHANQHIGHMLSISEKTVKFHLTNIFKKMNLKNRTQLTIAVLSNKVKEPNRTIIGKL